MFVFTLLSKLLELLARTDLVGFTFPGLIFTFLSSIPPSPLSHLLLLDHYNHFPISFLYICTKLFKIVKHILIKY